MAEVKQFLDKNGVNALWNRIYNGFAPRWQSYKPSNSASTSEDRTPADFINTYLSNDYFKNGTKEDGRKALDITFISAGAIKDADNNKYGRDLIVQIPEVKAPSSKNAGDGEYGVMSPDDKWKLDNVGATAEDAVTIKGVKVKNSDLKLTNKFVNWDLQYDTTSNELRIIDLNNSNAVMTSVDMDNILPDVITKGFLQSAVIVNKDENNNDGLFLKLTFVIELSNGAGTEFSDIYINVKDLIDIYNPGTGISITQTTAPSADGTERTSTINLKTAATNEIGGIKVKADNSTNDNTSTLRNESNASRDFGVVINKDDVAYVNIPITSINIVDSTVKDDSVEVITGTDKIQILKGYAKSANGSDGWTLTPQYSEITFGKETNITTKGDTGSNTTTLSFGGTFDILKTIEEGGTNGHELTRTKSTLTMPTETTLSLGNAADKTSAISIATSSDTATINSIVNVPVAKYSGSIETSEVTAVNNHTVTKTKTTNTFTFNVPAIEESFINSLVYRVE